MTQWDCEEAEANKHLELEDRVYYNILKRKNIQSLGNLKTLHEK